MPLPFSIFGNRYIFTFKFIGLTCLCVALFLSLGWWQCSRAQQKRLLIQAYTARANQLIVFSNLFNETLDSRYYSIQLKGHFDNEHQILLDNKTHEGRVGYEVYTPFLLEGTSKAVLIDRGWVPADNNRAILPEIKPISQIIFIKGIVNKPPAYFSLGEMMEKIPQKQLRVQYIDLKQLGKILGYSLAPYIIWLDPAESYGFVRQWKVTLMGPEKHIMYAVQWFAFALCLLVIFTILNLHRV